ncbi:hypothetical protein, partial [Cronobacter sakazakii]|uniref:hypothetical protein n=1 Tax=Cronobacter sakazakii TaxID=28141 RepID=UPI001BCB2171
DEFDRNLLAFEPYVSVITGTDWDHPDIYPTRQGYEEAFTQFVSQSQHTILWQEDADKTKLQQGDDYTFVDENDAGINKLPFPGIVNRKDAWQVAQAFAYITGQQIAELLPHRALFPGVSRRFELLAPRLYTDCAHTPPKFRGTLETAEEIAPDNVVVVYEGLHNTRQHFIKDDLQHLFDGVKQL